MMDVSKISTLPPKNAQEEQINLESESLREQLAKIQAKLLAQRKYSVLVVLQGMDASGKDGAVKKVFSGINPAGCRVKSFKVPTEEEFNHDFLWRIHKECPEKGMIQIFNRSHYEDILVPAVNQLLSKKAIEERFDHINSFEHLLVSNNTIIFKFYLHVSKKEQLKRVQSRMDDPDKRWKYQQGDVAEIERRDKYLEIYNTLFSKCDKAAPWHIVPSDDKWYKEYFILNEMVKTLKKYDIQFPSIDV